MARKTTQKADAKDIHLQGLCSEDIAYFFDSKDEHRNHFFTQIYRDRRSHRLFPDIAVLLRAVDNFSIYLQSGKYVYEILFALNRNKQWINLADKQKEHILICTHRLVLLLRAVDKETTQQMEQAETDLEKEMACFDSNGSPLEIIENNTNFPPPINELICITDAVDILTVTSDSYAPSLYKGENILIVKSDFLHEGKVTVFENKSGSKFMSRIAPSNERNRVTLINEKGENTSTFLDLRDVTILGYVAYVFREIK